MLFEPAVSFADIVVIDFVEHSVKCRAVVEVNQMRDFMRDDRAPDKIRCLDKPPIQPDPLAIGTTPPAPLCPGKRNRYWVQLGDFAVFGRVLFE